MNPNCIKPLEGGPAGGNQKINLVLAFGSDAITALDSNVQQSLQTIQRKKLPVVLFHKKKGAGLALWSWFHKKCPGLLVEVMELEHPLFAPLMGLERKSPQEELEKRKAQRQLAQSVQWGLAVFDPVYIDSFGHLQVSEEVLRVTIQLLLRHKPVRFFYRLKNGFENAALLNLQDLQKIMEAYEDMDLFAMEQVYITSHRDYDPALQPGDFLVSLLRRTLQTLMMEEQEALAQESSGPGAKKSAMAG